MDELAIDGGVLSGLGSTQGDDRAIGSRSCGIDLTDMDRVLITGANGLLGSNLALILKQRFMVSGTYRHTPLRLDGIEPIPLDITDESGVAARIGRLSPHIIIHCAAETRVDYCEEFPQHAFRVNVEGTKNLAKVADRIGIKFIYISSDSVFDGCHGMYDEEAKPNPLNVYAQTKLLGERVVQDSVLDYIVIRTNIYGWNAGRKFSLAEWILDRLDQGQAVPGFSDICFSPILVNDLADVLIELIEKRERGLYHVAASESCSKYDFARMVCEVFSYDPALVKSACSEDAALKARRAKNASLDIRKITGILGRPMPRIFDGIVRFRRLRDDGYTDRLRARCWSAEAYDV